MLKIQNLKAGRRGFSLIEIIVYVSILSVALIFLISSIVSIYRVFLKTRIERRLTLNGDVVMETMIRDIRLATSTSFATSFFGSHPGILDLGNKKFFLSGETLKIEEGVGPAQVLTSNVRVTNLVFHRMTASGTSNSELISISLTLESGPGPFLTSKNFNASAVQRAGY